MWRDGERELIAGEQNAAAFFLAKIDMLLELGERRDPIFKLPLPIGPEFRRDPAVAGPITLRVRDELFAVTISCVKSVHFVLRTKKTLKPLTIVSTQAPPSARVTYGRAQSSLQVDRALRSAILIICGFAA